MNFIRLTESLKSYEKFELNNNIHPSFSLGSLDGWTLVSINKPVIPVYTNSFMQSVYKLLTSKNSYNLEDKKTSLQRYHHPVTKQLAGSCGYVQAFYWLTILLNTILIGTVE